jgi:hypothetical protein
MAQIKPAIDALGEVAARKDKSGATLRVTASGRLGRLHRRRLARHRVLTASGENVSYRWA